MQGSSDTRKRSGRDKLISTFTIAVEGFDLAKELLNITPAKEAFGSASIILTMIRDAMLNDKGYIGLGIDCAGVCMALGRAMHDKPLAELNPSVSHAITQLTDTVTKIENSIVKKRRRWKVVKYICARIDMRTINSWRAELNNIMMLFNAELALNIYNAIADLVNELRAMKINRTSTPAHALESGESPPPPPRVCIGRDALIEDLVRRAEELEPSALTGTGGLGKTAIALAVLHHPRVVRKFSDRRRFIRCDEFPNSLVNFLDRISTVIGAGITNVTSLVPLRPFIEAQPMILVLDNAETILDEQTQDGTAIYQVIEELCRLRGLCLIITSRLSTIPSDCKRVEVSPLSSGAAQEIFYRIYPEGERSDLVNGLLERLDFHPLSITILATVASRKSWDYQRILEEWEKQKVKVLQTNHESLHLAASIEVSLDSPTFKNLGPKAREILGVVAFFPLGINGKKLDWLLPEVSDREDMIDTFCALSLTSRYKGFVTMLAPLREYLRPEDLGSSSLLWRVKERYFSRLHLADEELQPGIPGFDETKWVIQEESNVEHLLETFVALAEGSEDVWEAYADFLLHLSWHKPAQNTPAKDNDHLVHTPNHRHKFLSSFGKQMLHPLSDNLLGQKVINRFDKVLATGAVSHEEANRCLQVLGRMCKRQGMLPESMRVSIDLHSVDPRDSGFFSTTYHCEHNGNPVTVKVINACFTPNLDGVVNGFFREAIFWKYLPHPNIARFVGVDFGHDRFAMVSERMAHGDIVEYIRSHPEVNRVQLLVDAAIGLEYLHNHNMVHGDLRGANIFINKHLCACLSDFGFSTGLGVGDSDSISSSSTTSLVPNSRNIQWASPELLLGGSDGPTKQSDCYALGMVVYEVLCGEAPYQGKHPAAVIHMVVTGRRPPKPEAAASPGFVGELWNMVKATWEEDPKLRPNVEEILRCLRSAALAWDTRSPAPLGCR